MVRSRIPLWLAMTCMIALLFSTGLVLSGCNPNVPARLTVQSEPSGASVLLDGLEIGRTPGTFEGLTPGKRKLSLVHPGYREWHADVELLPGKEREVSASLSPLPPDAMFEVRSEPSGADVFIDGRYCGKTPVTLEIPQSTFCLTVAKPGYLWVQEFLEPKVVRSASRDYSAPMKVGGLSAEAYLLPGGWSPDEPVGPAALPNVTLARDRMVIGPLETESRLQISNAPRVFPGGDLLAMVVTAPTEKWLGGRWGESLVIFDLSTGERKAIYSTSGAVLGESQRLGLPGIRILGFQDESRILILTWSQGEHVPEFEVRVLNMETGQEELRIPGLFSPADGRQLCSWWLSRDKKTLFLELYRFANEIVALDLTSGKVKATYSGVPQSPAYGYPVIAPSPDGWQILWGMRLPESGLHVVDLREGKDRKILPEAAVFNEAWWSPDGRRVAVPVGATEGKWKRLHSYQETVLLADAVWVLSPDGQTEVELQIPGKLITDLVWLPDSSGVLAKTAMDVGEWNLVHTGTYALKLDGSRKELVAEDIQGVTLLTDLPQVNTKWVFLSSWKENGEEHWAFNSENEDLVKLPAKPIAVWGDVVLVRSTSEAIDEISLTSNGAVILRAIPSLDFEWWDVVEFTGSLVVIDGERGEERSGRFVVALRTQD